MRLSPTWAMFATSPSTSTAATVVAMPSYSERSRVASSTRRLAWRIAVFRRLPSYEIESSRPNGQVISSSPAVRATNSQIAATATREATSPAAWPPMPSATTNRFCSGSATIESSLPFRLRPTSLRASLRTLIAPTLGAPQPQLGGQARDAGIPGRQALRGGERLLGAQAQALGREHPGEVREGGRVLRVELG